MQQHLFDSIAHCRRCVRACVTFSFVLVMAAGCTSDTLVSPDQTDDALLSATDFTFAGKADHSTSPVYTFSDMTVVGSSDLVRTPNGVSFTLETSSLEPGDVVTLWMVIFNAPEHCVDGCGVDDLGNPDVMTDVVYAAGRVIGGSGKATYAGHRKEGDDSGSILPAWLGLPSPGLVDAQEAEIHLIVHSHGPKIPGLISEMLHSFNAGCGPIFEAGLPPVPEELGTHGPNTCVDVQFAVHLP